jgi:hypothetical protein
LFLDREGQVGYRYSPNSAELEKKDYLEFIVRAGGSRPPLLYLCRLPALALCILTEFAIMFLKLEESGK